MINIKYFKIYKFIFHKINKVFKINIKTINSNYLNFISVVRKLFSPVFNFN
jgi:hypothetical protein